MKRLLPLHLGLLAGGVAGLVVYCDSLTRATATLPLGYRAEQWEAALAQIERQRLADPHDDYAGPNYAGEVLVRTNLRGRDLRGGDFTNATLCGVDFTGAYLDGATFDGARYDAATRWPVGFDPVAHGASAAADVP